MVTRRWWHTTELWDCVFFQTYSFHLVISDILPMMDGFELCKEIRKQNEKIPILMLTVLGSTDDKLDGFDAGRMII